MQKHNFRQLTKYFLVLAISILANYFGAFTHVFELHYGYFFNYPLRSDAVQSKVAPVNYYNFTFLHNPVKKCQGGEAALTILIKSAIPNAERREAIRRTWGFETRFSDVKIRRIFVLGATNELNGQMALIEAEAIHYGDILQADFIDAYFNNTIKTALGMRWSTEFCSNSRHFLFVDDDYFVSIKNLLRFVANPLHYPLAEEGAKQVGANETLFAGFVLQTSPHRHKSGKWFVSLAEYPFHMWPPYVTAGAFVLSRRSLEKLYRVSLHTQHFRFDDIFLGIVALRAGIVLTHCQMFHFNRPRFSGPKSYRYVVASHGFSDPVEMERIWSECRSAGYS